MYGFNTVSRGTWFFLFSSLRILSVETAFETVVWESPGTTDISFKIGALGEIL